MSFGAGLNGDQLLSQNLLGHRLSLFRRLGDFHPARFAASAGVNLRLDDHLAAQFAGYRRSPDAIPRGFTPVDGHAKTLQDLLALKFVNLHVWRSVLAVLQAAGSRLKYHIVTHCQNNEQKEKVL